MWRHCNRDTWLIRFSFETDWNFGVNMHSAFDQNQLIMYCWLLLSYKVTTLLMAWWRNQIETCSALLAFVRGMHKPSVNFPHKGQWSCTLFSLICAYTNGWVDNRDAGDLRCHRTHYDVIVMGTPIYQRSVLVQVRCELWLPLPLPGRCVVWRQRWFLSRRLWWRRPTTTRRLLVHRRLVWIRMSDR